VTHTTINSGDAKNPASIVIELLFPDARAPRRATEGSAGYDLCAYVAGRTIKCSDGQHVWDVAPVVSTGAVFALDPGLMALIPLGFKARLPSGLEAQIRPRSGTTFKKGLQIPNAPGTIDSDFPDEWMVIVRNGTGSIIRIEHGERIAQMVVARYETPVVEAGTVGISTSRSGGFGSTGT
jgi:dUTP pyrophosphatase